MYTVIFVAYLVSSRRDNYDSIMLAVITIIRMEVVRSIERTRCSQLKGRPATWILKKSQGGREWTKLLLQMDILLYLKLRVCSKYSAHTLTDVFLSNK